MHMTPREHGRPIHDHRPRRRPTVVALLAVPLLLTALPACGVVPGSNAREPELRQLGAPPPFDAQSAEVSSSGDPSCFDACPSVTIEYDGPPDLPENEAQRVVGQFLTDAGYFKSPPEWGCGWEDLDDPPERICSTSTNVGGPLGGSFLLSLKWIGKSQSDERAEALTLTLTILEGDPD